ncbi:MAG: hypothetical protein J1F28_02860 [Oscillospiraceae bacterium]|nr:hypothetical protein [Oscillospiraceae bacterium]
MNEEQVIIPEREASVEAAVRETMFIPSLQEIPLMNTITDTAKLCRRFNIGLTDWQIRKLCENGVIPFIKFGSKRMINWNILMRYVNSGGEFNEPPKVEQEPGIIARIPEKLRA